MIWPTHLVMDEINAEEFPEPPSLRATVLGEHLTVTDWAPSLFASGPARDFFRARQKDGVAIADLRRWRNDDGSGELSVEFLSDGERPTAERVIEEWARLTGYSRVWFPDRVLDLTVEGPPPLPTVEATCPTCWATWADEDAEFWQIVRTSGEFPRICPVCGCELPQWRIAKSVEREGFGATAGSEHEKG